MANSGPQGIGSDRPRSMSLPQLTAIKRKYSGFDPNLKGFKQSVSARNLMKKVSYRNMSDKVKKIEGLVKPEMADVVKKRMMVEMWRKRTPRDNQDIKTKEEDVKPKVKVYTHKFPAFSRKYYRKIYNNL